MFCKFTTKTTAERKITVPISGAEMNAFLREGIVRVMRELLCYYIIGFFLWPRVSLEPDFPVHSKPKAFAPRERAVMPKRVEADYGYYERDAEQNILHEGVDENYARGDAYGIQNQKQRSAGNKALGALANAFLETRENDCEQNRYFDERSASFVQFSNEILAFKRVIPVFQHCDLRLHSRERQNRLRRYCRGKAEPFREWRVLQDGERERD